MDTILQTQLQRIETAFNSLIESITSYNPSPVAAAELVAADDSLCEGLEQLSTHQANNTHILRLRHTVQALEAEIKTTVSKLADARAELLADARAELLADAPAYLNTRSSSSTSETGVGDVSAGGAQTHGVPLDELLAYAKRISKFTVAPTGMRGGRKGKGKGVGGEGEERQVDGNGKGEEGKEGEDKANGMAVASLSELERKWQDQMADLPFVPWPTEEMIKSGGLAELQRMIERGEDPMREVGKGDEGRIKMEAESEEEESRRKREEEEDRRRRDSAQVGGASRGAARESQPAAVFKGLDLYDPDDI